MWKFDSWNFIRPVYIFQKNTLFEYFITQYLKISIIISKIQFLCSKSSILIKNIYFHSKSLFFNENSYIPDQRLWKHPIFGYNTDQNFKKSKIRSKTSILWLKIIYVCININFNYYYLISPIFNMIYVC